MHMIHAPSPSSLPTSQMSWSVYNRLAQCFECDLRGDIAVKGKGFMKTYFLVREAHAHTRGMAGQDCLAQGEAMRRREGILEGPEDTPRARSPAVPYPAHGRSPAALQHSQSSRVMFQVSTRNLLASTGLFRQLLEGHDREQLGRQGAFLGSMADMEVVADSEEEEEEPTTTPPPPVSVLPHLMSRRLQKFPSVRSQAPTPGRQAGDAVTGVDTLLRELEVLTDHSRAVRRPSKIATALSNISAQVGDGGL